MKLHIHLPILYIVICPLLLILTCCERHTEAWQKMNLAESLMETAPDSALGILKEISTDGLRKPSDKAMYGLLYTQASAKEWLEPKNDSLISIAVDYYESVNDPYRQAMSNYYQGVVRFNNENYTSAILSFFKAKEISESNDIFFYAGMSCRGIADIYNESYNSAEELHFAELEYKYIKKSGKQPYLNYALLDYGRALYNTRDFNKSMKITEQIMDSARLCNDDYLNLEALRLNVSNFISKREYRQAYPLLSEICKSNFSITSDSLNLGEVMFEIGNIDEAMQLLKQTSDNDLARKKLLEYNIDRKLGNYQEALQELEFIDSENNKSFKTAVSHDLTTSLTDYYKIKKTEDQLKIKEAKIARNVSIVCATVAILVIVSLFVYYYRRQSRTISEKVLLAEQLTESLRRSKTENANSSEILKSLQSSKYELLDELCSIAYKNNDEKNRRRKVADAVDRLIEDLSSQSDKIDELGKRVDRFQDKLFSDFRNDFPKLKDQDYRLFLFLVLGFEMPTITLLLKESKIEAVYNRKRRLKVKISNLECDNRNKYLTYFN